MAEVFRKALNADFVREATREYRRVIEGEAPPPEKTRGDVLGEIIAESDFGCQRGSIAKLVSAIIGEEVRLPRRKDDAYFGAPGVCVVPLNNPNGHDYEIGEPVVLINSTIAIRMNGAEGNHLPTGTKWRRDRELRVATDEEVESFIAEFEKNQMSRP